MKIYGVFLTKQSHLDSHFPLQFAVAHAHDGSWSCGVGGHTVGLGAGK